MLRNFAVCLAIATLTLSAPRAAEAAAITHTFDTVDAVEFSYQGGSQGHSLIITGLLVGSSTPTTQTFRFYGSDPGPDQLAQCIRMAQLSMASPGKYRFAIGSITVPTPTSAICKLSLSAP